MSKSKAAFYVLLGISCQFAFFSLWIALGLALVTNIVGHIFYTDLVWNLSFYGTYYVFNAVLCLFLGILAGFDVKKRFFGPILMVVCLLPTLVFFRFYTDFWDWFCVATTFVVGIGAMVVSAVVTKKKAEKSNIKTNAVIIGVQS